MKSLIALISLTCVANTNTMNVHQPERVGILPIFFAAFMVVDPGNNPATKPAPQYQGPDRKAGKKHSNSGKKYTKMYSNKPAAHGQKR